jgi:hypothetical protein
MAATTSHDYSSSSSSWVWDWSICWVVLNRVWFFWGTKYLRNNRFFCCGRLLFFIGRHHHDPFRPFRPSKPGKNKRTNPLLFPFRWLETLRVILEMEENQSSWFSDMVKRRWRWFFSLPLVPRCPPSLISSITSRSTDRHLKFNWNHACYTER